MANVNKKATSGEERPDDLVPAQFKVARRLRSGFKRKSKLDGFNSQIVMRILMERYIKGEISL